jgi:hypothetical protein
MKKYEVLRAHFIRMYKEDFPKNYSHKPILSVLEDFTKNNASLNYETAVIGTCSYENKEEAEKAFEENKYFCVTKIDLSIKYAIFDKLVLVKTKYDKNGKITRRRVLKTYIENPTDNCN